MLGANVGKAGLATNINAKMEMNPPINQQLAATLNN